MGKEILDFPIEETDREGAEVVVWTQERGAGFYRRGCRRRFGEGGSIDLVGDNLIQRFQGTSLAAMYASGSRFQA